MKQPSIGNTEHFPPFNDTNDSQDVVEDASEIPEGIKLDGIDMIFIVALILSFLLIVAVVCRYVTFHVTFPPNDALVSKFQVFLYV